MRTFIPKVFWLTGLSGAGKTTIGELLSQRLRAEGNPVIFLDGDILREIYGDVFGHDREQRMLASQRYGQLCQMLVNQQVSVVCATISMFHEIQAWNRANIQDYVEVFVNVPLSELVTRDSKKIYSRGLKGELTHIVGLDIEPEYPKNPDITIHNYEGMTAEHAVNLIMDFNQQLEIGSKQQEHVY